MAQPHLQQQPPFTHIPGVNPDLSIGRQVEQIDQLNTLLLQEIDANFARFHQIITARILPQIKRYALAAEPVKEGAKFWRRFYETAADVHVQIASDNSLATHDEATREDSLEESFMFDGAASSTPLPNRSRYEDSFSESMASPFDTLERRLRDDLRIDESDMATPSLPSGYDMSLASSTSTPRAPSAPAPPTPRGVVDLRATPLNTKFKPKLSLADLDDDDDDYALDMSPPVTMHFQLPPKAAQIASAGRTPQKDTAQRIVNDLMNELSSPRMPTPEGLGRYSIAPPIAMDQSGSRTFRQSINSSFDSDEDDDDQDMGATGLDFGGAMVDDSFASTASDMSMDGTVFGSKVAQGGPSAAAFNLHQQAEMVTFHGGSLEQAAGREVANTPTRKR